MKNNLSKIYYFKKLSMISVKILRACHEYDLSRLNWLFHLRIAYINDAVSRKI